MIDLLRSDPGSDPVVIEAVFPARPERLFDAWTTPADLHRWFGRDPEALAEVHLDLRKGGTWRFRMRPGPAGEDILEGEYLIIERASRLEFTWVHARKTHDGRLERTKPSKVALRFEPMGAATRVVLTHSEIVTVQGRDGVRDGWSTSFRAIHALVSDERGTAQH